MPKIVYVFGFGILYAECDTHGGSHTDRGCATNDHVADYVGDLLVSLAGDVNFFIGQLRLIDEAYAG